MWGGTERKGAIEAIKASYELGVTSIDTAPIYGQGTSEEIVGEAIKDIPRDKVQVLTKYGMRWDLAKGEFGFASKDNNGNDIDIYKYAAKDSIIKECEDSLRRLGTDYIDLYQTHWQDPTTPIAETMQTLLDLKQEGKIRAIGVSNISPEELAAYQEVGQLDSAQERYSMLDRDIETTLLPYCREHHISMLSYSSLSLGLLTGKIGPDREFSGDDQRIENPRFSVENRRKIAAMLAQFKPIAQARELTLAQLVIAWTIAQPGITFALCGARNARQAVENARAGRITLTADELGTIDRHIQCYARDIP